MPEIAIDTTAAAMDAPHPGGQAGFAADWTNGTIALAGGWMAGKTWVGARKLVTLHIYNAITADGDATFVPSAVAAPTYPLLMKYDFPEIEKACQEANLRCIYKAKQRAVILPDLGTRSNPSLIGFYSAERPDRIAGWQAGAGWGDEATRWPQNWLEPHRDAYLQFQSRIRHPDARFIQKMFTYTEEGDATRMYNEMHSGKKGYKIYSARTLDNPLAADYDAQQRESLTPELAMQYLDGVAVNLKGQRAYATFTEDRNVDKDLILDKHLPLCVCFDFNINPGMHVLIGQYSKANDEIIITHEIHERRMNLRQSIQALAVLIKDKLGGWQWPEMQIFGDATGESQWAGTGESCWQIVQQGIQDMGIPYRVRVPKANPMQIDRINAVNVAMMDLRNRVHFRCHPRCAILIKDFKRVKTDERGRLDKQALDLSHASDAIGYYIEYIRPARVQSNRTTAGRIGFGS